MAKPREYFKFNFSKVVKFDCTCGRRYINTDKCLQETDSRTPQTRADVIRSMSDEELAEFLPIVSDMMCQPTDECMNIICNRGECTKTTECALKWLQSEAE